MLFSQVFLSFLFGIPAFAQLGGTSSGESSGDGAQFTIPVPADPSGNKGIFSVVADSTVHGYWYLDDRDKQIRKVMQVIDKPSEGGHSAQIILGELKIPSHEEPKKPWPESLILRALTEQTFNDVIGEWDRYPSPSSDGIIPTAQHGQKAICKALNKYTLQVKEPRRAHRAAFIAVTVMAPNAARGHWYRDNSESRQVMQVGAISQLRHKIKLGNVNLPSAGNPDPWPAPGSLKELTPEDVNKVGGEPKWMRYPHPNGVTPVELRGDSAICHISDQLVVEITVIKPSTPPTRKRRRKSTM